MIGLPIVPRDVINNHSAPTLTRYKWRHGSKASVAREPEKVTSWERCRWQAEMCITWRGEPDNTRSPTFLVEAQRGLAPMRYLYLSPKVVAV